MANENGRLPDGRHGVIIGAVRASVLSCHLMTTALDF
jgi:hypothetical protein